jgi:membrane fusion protein (multidrug efflux system)
MPTSFSRSLRSLEADRFRFSLLGIVVGILLLATWIAWFFLARVALYEVSDRARLEVGSEPHVVMSLVSGRVERSAMDLDSGVEEGDVLVELDATEVRFLLEEKRAEAEGLRERLEQVRRETVAQEQALVDTRQAALAAQEEAQAGYQGALELARFAEQEALRKENLRKEGLVSRAEADAAATEYRQKLKLAEAFSRSIERKEGDRAIEISEKEAELVALEGRASEIRSNVRRLQANIAGLEYDVSLHTIRAPVSGRIGDRLSLRVGEFVEKGVHLGTVIPSGEVRVVAEFAPDRALGRIFPGQQAKLRLAGFSWVQYGSVPATVSRVGKEPQNGTVRVELALDEPEAFPVALSHGLPGTLDVEVERISPAALVLRAAGNVVSAPVR